jgi:hypothetical protein
VVIESSLTYPISTVGFGKIVNCTILIAVKYMGNRSHFRLRCDVYSWCVCYWSFLLMPIIGKMVPILGVGLKVHSLLPAIGYLTPGCSIRYKLCTGAILMRHTGVRLVITGHGGWTTVLPTGFEKGGGFSKRQCIDRPTKWGILQLAAMAPNENCKIDIISQFWSSKMGLNRL